MLENLSPPKKGAINDLSASARSRMDGCANESNVGLTERSYSKDTGRFRLTRQLASVSPSNAAV